MAEALPNLSPEELLQEGAESIGIPLAPEEVNRYLLYAHAVRDWNARMNLTATSDVSELLVKHILDSLTCFRVVQAGASVRTLDVGTGAGFPGMVIKIHSPPTPLTFLDRTRKKLMFLEHLACLLGLTGIEIVHARAEEAGRDPTYRERFDLVVARAVADLPVLLELCLPFVRVGGCFLAMKGPQGEAELERAKQALSLLGGVLERKACCHLPFGAGKRRLLLFGKSHPTPLAYPRRPGVPERRPL